jgi:hypothetical protein
MVEAGSSKTGKSNIVQSLVVDTRTLAATACDLVCEVDGTINVDEMAPPLGATFDLLGVTHKSGTVRVKRAMKM